MKTRKAGWFGISVEVPITVCLALWTAVAWEIRGASFVLEPAIPSAGVADGPVFAVMTLEDGRILVGGGFDTIGGIACTNLARLHANGEVDVDNVSGADSGINRFVRQPDGKILVGGSFSELQGHPRRGIARLLADGSFDPSFDAGTNYPDTEGVLTIAVQPDGKIVAASYFSSELSRLQRLNEDGSLDPTFANTNIFDYFITALLVHMNGSIWAGGGFRHVNSEPRNGIAVVDNNGLLEANSLPALAPFSDIFSFVELTNGNVLAGGTLIRDTTNVTLLARLTPQLHWDDTYVPDRFNTPGCVIGAMLLQPDGNLVVAGNFNEVGGYSRRGFARLNSDGHVDPCFDPGLGIDGSFGGLVGATSLALQSDGRILVGGFFTGDLGVTNMARLLPQSDCGVTQVYLRQHTPDTVSIAATCTPGGTNLLESSTNLVDWTIVGASFSPYLPFINFDSSLPATFFRARKAD